MYIRVHIKNEKRIEKDIFAGYFFCPKCGRSSGFHLYRIKQRISLSFIPIYSITTDRLIVCDTCGTYNRIDRSEYRSMKKRQEKVVKEGGSPEYVIKTDYCPSEIKYGRKIIALVLTSLFAFNMIVGTILMFRDISEWDASVLIGGLFMFLLGVLPFLLALKSFIEAKWKKRLYQSNMKFESDNR